MASTNDLTKTLADALGIEPETIAAHASHLREAGMLPDGDAPVDSEHCAALLLGAMIRIDMIGPDTRHPDKRRQHHGRASCEVGGQRFETEGPAPIYKLVTLLWLHGHGSADFEVWDNLSPTGKPGGLAMTGRVRNWARLVKGKPSFAKDAPSDVDYSPHERELIARAAGNAAEIDSPRPGNSPTAAISPPDGPSYPREQHESSAGLVGTRTPEAA